MTEPNRYQLNSTRLQRKASPVVKMISWLLIMIISTAPFQSSTAMYFDLNTPDQNNRVLVDQLRETEFASDSQSCIVCFCQSLSVCAAHLNCDPVTSSSPLQLSAQARFFYHALIGDVVVSTRFPDLLKRPPDHSPLITC